jgi:hypothetical protein|tara:strand:+ start:330 stop:515 length:186 start_codon:yes stop_codon:yes gene_type:complete
MRYRGYFINLKPLDFKGSWSLEIERGNFVSSRGVSSEMTIKQVEDYAFKEIDKLIEQEKNT